MSYHKDPEVNRAIIELLDALCQWERGSGNGSTLLLIPHNPEEPLVLAVDGKPVSQSAHARGAACATNLFHLAFTNRKEALMRG
jgi:hypothetical protein